MTAARRKTILVMDDSTIVLETLRVALEAEGYSVLTALNLTELETARAHAKPDLLILDVQMPEAFGDDIAQVLREVRHVDVPILLFSALDEGTLGERARAARLDGYVPKCEGVPALLARVNEILS